MIDFCTNFNIILNHISTMSVSGYGLVEVKSDALYDEDSFYINQNYNDNIYVKTKLLAENEIYKSLKDGLIANIYRAGNLTNSFNNLKAQINSKENGFLNRLRSIKESGVVPEELKNFEMEFTPVDYCADAIVKIITSLPINKNINIYHLYNNRSVPIETFIELLNEFGTTVHNANKNEFVETIMKNSYNPEELRGFINHINLNLSFKSNDEIFSNKVTIKKLKSLEFEWPEITENYLKNIIIGL